MCSAIVFNGEAIGFAGGFSTPLTSQDSPTSQYTTLLCSELNNLEQYVSIVQKTKVDIIL